MTSVDTNSEAFFRARLIDYPSWVCEVTVLYKVNETLLIGNDRVYPTTSGRWGLVAGLSLK